MQLSMPLLLLVSATDFPMCKFLSFSVSKMQLFDLLCLRHPIGLDKNFQGTVFYCQHLSLQHHWDVGRRSHLTVSVLVSASSGPGSSPGRRLLEQDTLLQLTVPPPTQVYKLASADLIEREDAYTNTGIKESHFLPCRIILPFLLAVKNFMSGVAFNLALKTSKDGFVLSSLHLQIWNFASERMLLCL